MNYNNKLKLLKLQQLTNIYIYYSLENEIRENAVSCSSPKVNFERVLSRVLLLRNKIHTCTSWTSFAKEAVWRFGHMQVVSIIFFFDRLCQNFAAIKRLSCLFYWCNCNDIAIFLWCTYEESIASDFRQLVVWHHHGCFPCFVCLRVNYIIKVAVW